MVKVTDVSVTLDVARPTTFVAATWNWTDCEFGLPALARMYAFRRVRDGPAVAGRNRSLVVRVGVFPTVVLVIAGGRRRHLDEVGGAGRQAAIAGAGEFVDAGGRRIVAGKRGERAGGGVAAGYFVDGRRDVPRRAGWGAEEGEDAGQPVAAGMRARGEGVGPLDGSPLVVVADDRHVGVRRFVQVAHRHAVGGERAGRRQLGPRGATAVWRMPSRCTPCRASARPGRQFPWRWSARGCRRYAGPRWPGSARLRCVR